MPLSSGVPISVENAIHGVAVRDPYRWLEDGNSAETRDWITDQQRLYDDYFAESADLDWVRNRVRKYLDIETVDQPAKIGSRYFFRKRDTGSERACIYVRDASTGQERILVDPSTRDDFASVGIHRISFDGSLLAYELRHGGTDTAAIHLVDVRTGAELPDRVEMGFVRGFAFASDQTGFYYSRESDEISEDHQILFHRFGEQTTDQVVYRLPRSAGSRLILTSDEVYLGAVSVHLYGGEPVINLELARRDTPAIWKRVLANVRRTYRPFLNNGRIYAISFENAPNGKLLELNDDGCENRVVIAEQAYAIQQVVVIGDRIILTHLQDWGMFAESWTVSGKYIGKLHLPTDGTIRLLQSQGSEALFCSYESLSETLATFELAPSSGKLGLWHKQTGLSGQRPCHIRALSAPSRDGTRIPLMVAAQRIPAHECSATPLILTGYGGFGASVTPQHSVFVSVMLELGSTFVLAQLRGGGEFGEAWHEAANGANRQNAFDDFIAAAEWLCAKGFTTPRKLAIFGGSNAGLLVGAVLTQRPELFGAVLCVAPLLDMVRYEKFDLAARWRHEYGSVDNPEDFRALLAYSPYHNIKDDTNYPSVLFISGDKDQRCNPAHVRKMAAWLQQRDAQTCPVLVDYSRDRGHSPGLPLSVRIESLARRITFLCGALNVTQQGVPR
jgi:prolyl oligopeptidase